MLAESVALIYATAPVTSLDLLDEQLAQAVVGADSEELDRRHFAVARTADMCQIKTLVALGANINKSL